MTKNLEHFKLDENLLMKIDECSRVFDLDECEIGHVDDVFLGAYEKEGVPENIFHRGFVHVSDNDLEVGWVVLPEQIDTISNGKVILNLPMDELMKYKMLEDAFA